VYGSTFFIATGFHGLHVIIGTAHLWRHGPRSSFSLNKFFNLTINLTTKTIPGFCGKPAWPS
jgi:heme/copper-type cytochrome/quinol oxidase subunit 3